MKIITIASLFIVFCFINCTNEISILDDGSGNTILTSGLKATVNGEEFTSSTAEAIVNTFVNEIDNTTETLLNISASNDSGLSFSIILDVDDFQEGTYTQANGTSSIIYNLNGVAYTANAQVNGSSFSLNLTNIDTTQLTLQGTFTATLVNPADENDRITITNGEFNGIVYMESTTTEHNASGTFTVEIDGTATTVENIRLVENSQTGFVLSGEANMQDLVLSFPNNPNVATNTLATTGDYQATYIVQATAGDLTFTNFTPTNVAGTFAFDVDNAGTTISLTNGVFDLNY